MSDELGQTDSIGQSLHDRARQVLMEALDFTLNSLDPRKEISIDIAKFVLANVPEVK